MIKSNGSKNWKIGAETAVKLAYKADSAPIFIWNGHKREIIWGGDKGS